MLGRRGASASLRRKIDRWVAADALVVGRDGRGLTTTPRAVAAFLWDERFWPDWDPADLADPRLRRLWCDRRDRSELLTAGDVAVQYGISSPALKCARRAGLPTCFRVGRANCYRRRDIEAWDWTPCRIPAVKGLYFGRLRCPPRQTPRRAPSGMFVGRRARVAGGPDDSPLAPPSPGRGEGQ
jgi:hypothetical protein